MIWFPTGKVGNQYKKRTYTSLDAFNKHGTEWISRLSKYFDVSSYELLKGDDTIFEMSFCKICSCKDNCTDNCIPCVLEWLNKETE